MTEITFKKSTNHFPAFKVVEFVQHFSAALGLKQRAHPCMWLLSHRYETLHVHVWLKRSWFSPPGSPVSGYSVLLFAVGLLACAGGKALGSSSIQNAQKAAFTLLSLVNHTYRGLKVRERRLKHALNRA